MQLDEFLEAGSNVHSTDHEDCNVLHLLVDNLNCEASLRWENLGKMSNIWDKLLKNGANPNHINKQGLTVSMRMHHTVSDRVWDIWVSVLEETGVLKSVNTRDIAENVRSRSVILFYECC